MTDKTKVEMGEENQRKSVKITRKIAYKMGRIKSRQKDIDYCRAKSTFAGNFVKFQ